MSTALALFGIYAITVLGFAAMVDDDPDTPKTRSDRVRELAAAILWPLFHVQWRHSGRHHRVRTNAEFPWVGFEVPVATA
jgi:hypothetical protein